MDKNDIMLLFYSQGNKDFSITTQDIKEATKKMVLQIRIYNSVVDEVY